MTGIPVLHIIFYLTTLLLPGGTNKFTVSYSDQTVTWSPTLVPGNPGAWHATNDAGEDMGIWIADRHGVHTVTVGNPSPGGPGDDRRFPASQKPGVVTNTDLSKFLKIGTTEDPKKILSVGERPLTVTKTESTITLSQDKGGIFAKPVVITITYSTL